MIENRAEQKEALETLLEFNTRLVNNMKAITEELSGERMSDTDAFLEDIIKALNWEIQVVNGTLELLNENKIRLDKNNFNDKVQKLSNAIASKDDAKMSAAFQEIIPVFEALGEAAKEVAV